MSIYCIAKILLHISLYQIKNSLHLKLDIIASYYYITVRLIAGYITLKYYFLLLFLTNLIRESILHIYQTIVGPSVLVYTNFIIVLM